jgi:hypothetical protein
MKIQKKIDVIYGDVIIYYKLFHRKIISSNFKNIKKNVF